MHHIHLTSPNQYRRCDAPFLSMFSHHQGACANPRAQKKAIATSEMAAMASELCNRWENRSAHFAVGLRLGEMPWALDYGLRAVVVASLVAGPPTTTHFDCCTVC